MTGCNSDNVAAAAKLRSIFYPRSVALLGASDDPKRVGYNIFNSLTGGGFTGSIYPVHPRLQTVLGYRVYPSLAALPEQVDLAVIALNERATIAAIEECAAGGVRGAVCIAGGYRETNDAGSGLEAELLATARRCGVSFIGPNTLGFINNDNGLNTTFYPMQLPRGNVSFISQSGGMGLDFICRAVDAELGLNKWIGAGNRSDFEFADYLAFLGEDEGTGVIGLYLEGTEQAARMVRIAGNLAKPVVVYKAGRSGAADFAALTHTGSMAGSHSVYRDIFQQFGVYAVESMSELVTAVKALSLAPLPRGKRIGLMTHTAGPSIVAADVLLERGCVLPPLTPRTLAKVRELTGPNPPFALKNPLDVAGMGFMVDVYGQYLELLAADPNVDLVLAFFCHNTNPHWPFPSSELVRVRQQSGKPVVACYISRAAHLPAERAILEGGGVPLYAFPEEAAQAALALVWWAGRKSAMVKGSEGKEVTA
ncbi:MAG: CoA-binding protein [Bacillota bacterium]